MGLILYGSSLSPFVRKIRVILAEKAVPYALESINPFRPPPDFEKISPLKRIPVLRDSNWEQDTALPDSSVIADYLENRYPNPRLYPLEPFQRARALWFEEYVDGALFALMGPKLFFERIVKKFMRQHTEEAVCDQTVKRDLPPFFDYLDGQLSAKQWFAGDGFSIADITVGSIMVNFHHCGETLDARRWPNLAVFVKRVHARPSFAALIAEELPLIVKAQSMGEAPPQG